MKREYKKGLSKCDASPGPVQSRRHPNRSNVQKKGHVAALLTTSYIFLAVVVVVVVVVAESNSSNSNSSSK